MSIQKVSGAGFSVQNEGIHHVGISLNQTWLLFIPF